jgi:hypothetical protein
MDRPLDDGTPDGVDKEFRGHRATQARPPRDFPGHAVIVDLLTKIEALREHQSLLAWKLDHMLATGNGGSGYEQRKPLSPTELAELRRAWGEFVDQGGVSADDLKCFLRGETIGHVRPVQRQHLRLVRSSKSAGQQQRWHTDNDAA